MNRFAPLISLCLLPLLLLPLSCNLDGPPVKEIALTRIQHYMADTTQVGAALRDPFVASIGQATTTIDVALAGLDDDAVADALIAARARGVAVRVVTDQGSLGQPGFVKLLAAGVPVIAGDGPLEYLPEPNLTNIVGFCERIDYVKDDPVHYFKQCTRGQDSDPRVIVRPETFNQMSNNFAILDELIVWNWSTPLLPTPSYWLGWSAQSQDLAQAFAREFQQMAGGVFATTLDNFNGPVKSTVHGVVYDSKIPSERPGRKVDLQPGFLTDQGIMQVEFNPQQRLTKEVIDEIYRARGSVYLMTDTLYNDFLISALTYKKRAGFDVRVLVRAQTAQMAPLLEAPSVVHRAPEGTGYLPTMLIIDQQPDRNGTRWGRTGMVLSHPLYHQSPFEMLTPEQVGKDNMVDRANFVRVYPSDTFVDGTLWTLHEFLGSDRSLSPIDDLLAFWDPLWSTTQEISP